MLELKKINKKYLSGTNSVSALKEVNLKFRESEFVSILGPSGCGKTTLLNIIGGLDNYTSGDLIINGKSTKDFKDKDWDNYRNHRVGFVFQNYNLIPHQTVLQNVELALTLAGINKTERRKRAIQALKDVGLEDQIHKKPNQMSGGQMQRVAIARALVSNPDILLADEPTGALDSKTSVQIMELLSKIAKDKLVIMVTHNPDLAQNYSSRIIKLLDGKVIDDSNPYNPKTEKQETGKIGKTNMSFITAFTLSLNNLLTKKGRTILTAFAGSIGIIGIALILSLSSGMQNYINNIEEETLSSYPITIEENSMDTTEILNTIMSMQRKDKNQHNDNKIYSNNITNEMLSMMSKEAKSNNLYEFKKYLEKENNGILEKTNAVKYSYNLDLNIYRQIDNKYIKANPNELLDKLGLGEMANIENLFMGSTISSTEVFTELLDNKELNKKTYEIIAGHLPENYDEVVLIVDENNEISDYTLYSIGFLDSEELVEKYQTLMNGGTVEETPITSYTYDELLNTTFKVLLNTDYYEKKNGLWINKENDNVYMNKKLNNALEIKVVGIAKLDSTVSTGTDAYGKIGYTHDLTKYVINKVNESAIAKEQLANKEINVFTNSKFTTEKFDYNNLTNEQKAYLASLSDEELAALLEEYQNNATYSSNLKKLGIVDLEKPSAINIYAKDFDSKEEIASIIEDYNNEQKKNNHEENVISYSDIVGTMMSGISSIIDIISYVLIAFVSISLVVSSIMIGIITYISVLERTKEIGILRSIGASKKDISRVFNAETLIIGLTSGVFGILITLLLNIPINIIIKNITGVANISKLPFIGGIILILISIFLTIIAGLIPAKMASKKDPVEALRTE